MNFLLEIWSVGHLWLPKTKGKERGTKKTHMRVLVMIQNRENTPGRLHGRFFMGVLVAVRMACCLERWRVVRCAKVQWSTVMDSTSVRASWQLGVNVRIQLWRPNGSLESGKFRGWRTISSTRSFFCPSLRNGDLSSYWFALLMLYAETCWSPITSPQSRNERTCTRQPADSNTRTCNASRGLVIKVFQTHWNFFVWFASEFIQRQTVELTNVMMTCENSGTRNRKPKKKNGFCCRLHRLWSPPRNRKSRLRRKTQRRAVVVRQRARWGDWMSPSLGGSLCLRSAQNQSSVIPCVLLELVLKWRQQDLMRVWDVWTFEVFLSSSFSIKHTFKFVSFFRFSPAVFGEVMSLEIEHTNVRINNVSAMEVHIASVASSDISI